MLKGQPTDEYLIQVRQMLIYMLAWGVVTVSGAWLAGKGDFIPGFVTGLAGSLIYFLLMCYRVNKSARLSPEKAVAYMQVGWLIRFSFIIAMLVVSIHIPGIDFGAAVAGLFSLQIVLVLNAVVIVVAGLIAKSGKPKLH